MTLPVARRRPANHRESRVGRPISIVALSRLTRGLAGRMLLKLEYLNPGFSKKDRAALQVLRSEERDQTIVTVACDSGLKYLSTDLWPGA